MRGQGSTLLADHGPQEITAVRTADDGRTFVTAVRWVDQDGREQLTEERRLTAALLPEVDARALDWRSALRAGTSDLTIGSPATNGRPLAGYGGYFWRLPSGDEAHTFAPWASDESTFTGSRRRGWR